MRYFFHVNDTHLELLRQATDEEVRWYNDLADELMEYKKNVDRFERVDKNYKELIANVHCTGKSMMDVEKTLKNLTANFLYSFNECLDHWKTYIARSYGATSDFYSAYTKLTSGAFDSYDEYKVTYGLRNFQHIDEVVQRVSVGEDGKAKIYTNREFVVNNGGLNSKQKEAISRQPEWIELIPIFSTAKELLERINIKLLFYTVTPEIEKRAIDALSFKESIRADEGALLLGTLKDEEGNELVLCNETMEELSRNQAKITFDYSKEIPWGICKLLRFFKGTNYKQC